MKRKYIIGNWKSNKNINQAKEWFRDINKYLQKNLKTQFNHLEIVLCTSYLHLYLAREQIKKYRLPFKLGAQNVSPYTCGAYTGEISAEMLKDLVDYVIIGHSERRTYFHEDDNLLKAKVERLNETGLIPIFCVPNQKTKIPKGVFLTAYEPVWAIGSGRADSPENASRVISEIKKKNPSMKVIYGGSVNSANVVSFFSQKNIDGVLPGSASLDPFKFGEIVINAQSI